MTMTSPQFNLNVLSGPHTGAELPLESGTYSIGSHESCDLVFNDKSLSDKHLQIVLSSSGLAIRPLALPVYINGSELTQGRATINELDVITLGDTHFAVAGLNTTWPASIKLPHIDTKRNEPIADKSSGSFMVKNKIPIAIIVAGVIAFIAYSQPFSSKPLFESNESVIRKLLADQKQKHIELMSQPNGVIRLTGYVDNNEASNKLDKALASSKLKTISRIYSSDELLHTAKQVLQALGYSDLNVEITNNHPGTLVLEGFVDTSSELQQLVETLRLDVTGVRKVDHKNVETLEQRLTELNNTIVNASLDKKLTAYSEGGSLIVGGILSNVEYTEWEKIETHLQSQYTDHARIVNNIVKKHETIQLALRSVSIGQTAYLITKDGNKYMEGAYLDNGYMIKTIRPGIITLSKNHAEVEFLYGQK